MGNDNDSEEPQKLEQVMSLSRPMTGKRATGKYESQPWECDAEGGAKISMSGIMKAAWTVLFGLIVTALTAVGTVITAAAATIVTAVNAVTTAINALTVIQTDIRKQNQIRLLAGVAFTTTGTPTALFTAGAAYNNVKAIITNTSGSAYTFTLQHSNNAGSVIGKLAGPAYSLGPGDTTEITIGGMASGDKILGDATNAAVWLTVKGATE